MIERRVEVRPRWPVRLPRRGTPDGLARVRGGVLERLIHAEGEPVVVRAAQPASDRVVIGARAAHADAAEYGIERMRFTLGLDDDLRPFYERFRFDPLIGPSLRRAPWRRPFRRPDPFEALAWAIVEQLITFERAVEIQRAIVRALGRRCPETGLRDAPDATALAGAAPARLEACDLAPKRTLTLVRAAREVARGRVDLRAPAPDHEAGWRRLRTLAGIGPWTIEMLALGGQGRNDQLPAGDLAYRKLVGRMRSGNPRDRADEDEVRAAFAPYAPYAGLAGWHALMSPARRALPPPTARRAPRRPAWRAPGGRPRPA